MLVYRVLLTAFVVGSAAFGGPMTFFTTFQPVGCVDHFNSASPGVCAPGLTQTTLTDPSAPGNTMTFTNVASGGFGLMHLATTDSFNVTSGQAWSYGFGEFQDQITINSATQNGQAGVVNVSYFVDGSASSTGIADAFDQVVLRTTVNGMITNNLVDDFHGTVTSQTVTHTVNITYGQAFILYFEMQATGGTAHDKGGGPIATGGYNFITETGSGTASVHFENTFMLTGLTTFQGDGSTPVSDSTFTSASGTQYSQAGVIPEPATLVEGIGGLGVLGLLRARRRV